MATGATVRVWHEELGWGVLDCPRTPGGCWAHFSAVAVPGYRALLAGQRVELEWEPAEQDGYHYRAVRTWPLGQDPWSPPPSRSGAFSSELTVTGDEPGD